MGQRLSSSPRERGAGLEEALGPRVAAIFRSASRGPRLTTRVWAALRHSRFDGALARGADPCDSLTLAHRAARLTSERMRARLTKEIDGVIAAATRPGAGLSSAVPVDLQEVAAAAPWLIEIRELLGSTDPVYAKGVAMLKRLLRDGGGPLCCPYRRGDLRDELEAVIAALNGQTKTR